MALTFQIRVDDQGNAAVEKLAKNINTKVKPAADGLNKTIGDLGSTIVAAFSVAKVIQFGKASVDAFDAQIVATTKLKTALGFTSDELLAQASALQEVTRYGDETITGAQALLAMYGLTEKQIKQLTPAVLNYASATGTDLESAMDKVGRTIGTSTNALNREGIAVSDSTSKSQRLAEVLRQLETRFEGQAEAAGSVGKGGVIKLKNAFGDLMEVVGQSITESDLYRASLAKLGSEVVYLQKLIAGPQKIDIAKDMLKTLGSDVSVIESEIAKLKASLDFKLSNGSDPASFAVKAVEQTLRVKQAELKIVQDQIKSIKKENGLDDKKPIKPISDTVEGGSDKKEKALEAYRKKQADSFLALVKSNIAAMTEEDAMKQAFADKNEEIDLGIIASNAMIAQSIKEKTEAEKAYQQAVMYGAANMLGAFAGLNQAMKGNAEASKMLARGSVIIDTAAGIMKAYAQGGVLGFFTGAAIAAVGATQLANIDRQKFSTGGWVSGGGGGLSDNVNASLSPGERVISNRDVDRMGGKQAIDRAIDYGLQKAGGVTININGPVMAAKQYVRDILMPEIETYLARV